MRLQIFEQVVKDTNLVMGGGGGSLEDLFMNMRRSIFTKFLFFLGPRPMEGLIKPPLSICLSVCPVVRLSMRQFNIFLWKKAINLCTAVKNWNI